MVSSKLKGLNKPRYEVFSKEQQVPNRIQHLVQQNEKRARTNKFDVRTLSPNNRQPQVSTSAKKRIVLDKNEIDNYEKITRSDFAVK